MAEEHFKVSSGLKTLIGSELITDKNIAVFELVKNSFDAHATIVNIKFENLRSGESKITIADNGKGMSYDDLINKWLFVAFSAKKDDTEDKNDNDYRDRLKNSRQYAGAKGVGRFSSDRLGRKLKLITKTEKVPSSAQVLEVNWKLFDANQSELFQKIPSEHSTTDEWPYDFSHGTILEITEVFSEEWSRDDLKRLKDKLSKLVRPDLNDNKNERIFDIYLDVPEEAAEDLVQTKDVSKSEDWKIYRLTVNGQIKNFIFDLLNIKTTKIRSRISTNGHIITELVDREKSIYQITENNPFENLKNIDVTLYYMGRAAKINFTNRMGVDVVNYGNVFLYRNGFRIMPYGEPRDDSFGIDARGMQGFKRYLTTRTLIGQIEIYGDNLEFKESTSRDGGLLKTKAYDELVAFFFDAMRRLEKYVVEVANWGLDDEHLAELEGEEYKRKLVELLSNVSSDKGIVDLQYNKDVLDIVDSQERGSSKKIIRNFKRIGAVSNNNDLLKEAEKLEREWGNLVKDNKVQTERADAAIKVLNYTTGQNSFLKDSVDADTKELKSLLHHTEKSTYWINKHLENLIRGIEKKATKEELFDLITAISLENQKIFSFTKYHKTTKFNTFIGKLHQDIIAFANEYLINVCKYLSEYNILQIEVNTPYDLHLKTKFVAVEVPIIIDNLLNNSITAGAQNVRFEWRQISKNSVELKYTDDGKGIDNSILDKIFDFHFTTTRNGSGLGLYHIKKLLKDIGGDISAVRKTGRGAEFIIIFNA